MGLIIGRDVLHHIRLRELETTGVGEYAIISIIRLIIMLCYLTSYYIIVHYVHIIYIVHGVVLRPQDRRRLSVASTRNASSRNTAWHL